VNVIPLVNVIHATADSCSQMENLPRSSNILAAVQGRVLLAKLCFGPDL